MSRRWLDSTLGLSKPLSPISRRQLLRLGLAAGAGLLSAHSQAADRKTPAGRILVIGAGFSGLTCAYELASVGYDVKVLEASRRVGGRVHTLRDLVPGRQIEGGGEMLGSNHPRVLAYAARFGFEFRDVVTDESAPRPVLLGGKLRSPDEIDQLTAEIDRCLNRMTDDARAVVIDEPWKTPDGLRLDKTSTAQWIEQQEISPLARIMLTLQLTATNGVTTARQSYLGNLTQVAGGGGNRYWTDTEVARLAGGNQQFAERFARELGPDRVLFDSPVREVERSDNRVTVIDGAGRRHEGDDVVLAIPPSVWSTIRFTPALPESLAPQMGTSVKYLAVISDRLWQPAGLSANSTTDGNITQTWDATEGQGNDGPATMVAFSSGPVAEILHRMPVSERQPTFLKAFETLYPGFGNRFVKGLFMDWLAAPWTRGGYSFPAPGQVTTIGPVLRAGLGRLHFAGEHTCYPFVGYMEGALTSGASLAQRIAKRDNLL